jgi:ribonuclease Z
MKPTFHFSLVNGPFDDPCVFVRLIHEGRGLLFDAGDLGGLGTGNILKISDIFVTHTHMDHFIGLDEALRHCLKREMPLRLYGPKDLAERVEGKLGGYSWNLIREYPLKIEVFGIGRQSLSHTGFYAEDSFSKTVYPDRPFDGVLWEEPLFKVKGLLLSHEIPVVAYTLEEEYHININKARLEEKGLTAGPWLSSLKAAVRENYDFIKAEGVLSLKKMGVSPYSICFDGSPCLKDLMDIVAITKGQKVSYVMDVAPTDENLEKLIPFVRGSDILFCEAYFLERDRDRAVERSHLTAALAGRIAGEAEVGQLQILHFSPRYRDCEQELYDEAMREFEAARGAIIPCS